MKKCIYNELNVRHLSSIVRFMLISRGSACSFPDYKGGSVCQTQKG